MGANLSWPAVSLSIFSMFLNCLIITYQICSLTVLPFTTRVLTVKSTPMVVMVSWLNVSSTYLRINDVFPDVWRRTSNNSDRFCAQLTYCISYQDNLEDEVKPVNKCSLKHYLTIGCGHLVAFFKGSWPSSPTSGARSLSKEGLRLRGELVRQESLFFASPTCDLMLVKKIATSQINLSHNNLNWSL